MSSVLRPSHDDGAITLRCPRCKGSLQYEHEVAQCSGCQTAYRLESGLVQLKPDQNYHGELPRAEMQTLLESAREKGWKIALAANSDSTMQRIERLVSDSRRSRFLQLLPPISAGRVLDLGCGFGGVSLQLAQCFSQVFAMDGCQERVAFLNLARQQENIDNIVPFCHSDTWNMPFADEQLDLITLIGVFEYLPLSVPGASATHVQLNSLREFYRLLRPGGYLLLSTKNRYGWNYLKGEKDHNGIPFGPALPARLANLLSKRVHGKPYRIRNYSRIGYRRLLLLAGFADIKFYWPISGYQYPDGFLDLDSKRYASDLLVGTSYGKLSRLLFSLMAKARLLMDLVPNYTIVCTKPRQ